MRRLIILALLAVLTTACNIPSISMRLNRDLSGDNTVIVAVPNRNDCPSILTATNPTIEENLRTLQARENQSGTEMVFGRYSEGGLTGFRIIYPFKTPSTIPLQIQNIKEVMSLSDTNFQFPTISVPQPTENQFSTTYNVEVKLNPSDLLLTSGDCTLENMTFSLTMPGAITSYSPDSSQANVSVQKLGDTTVEWTLGKADEMFTLMAQSSIITGTPPVPEPSPSILDKLLDNIVPILIFLTAVIGLITAIVKWRS